MIPTDFKAKRHLYEALLTATLPLLERLALENDVTVALIEGRVKEEGSVKEKITRPDKEGKYHALEDITDLCGLRIVLYTDEDCRVVTEAVRKHFEVDQKNSIVKGANNAEDRFGYLSTHIVASLPKERVKLFEYKALENLKMEIQVRTVLQHAWAVLDWKLRYKTEKEIPKELRRKLYRVSALLEAADDTFSDLLSAAEKLRAEYGSEISQGKLDIPINKDSLQSFLSQSEVVKSVVGRCRQEGIRAGFKKEADAARGPDTAYDYLIQSLSEAGISTLGQFEKRLRAVKDEDIAHLVAIGKASGGSAFGIFSLLRILIVSQLSPEERHRVFISVPAVSPIGHAERRHFEAQ